MTRSASPLALLIALAACAGLVMQFIDTSGDKPDLSAPEVVWWMLRYFTILTNALVAATFLRMVLTGRTARAAWLGGLTLWIGIVGVVYHLLLARELTGFALVTDHMVHTVVPGLTVLYWLGFAPKGGLRLAHAGQWILWPLLYVIYALIRAQVDGVYPYFFVNLDTQGWPGVLRWSALLCGSFYIAGLAQIALARVLR